jgi:hypothetical protein
MTADTLAFRRVGLAHRAALDDGTAFWIRRNASHGVDLIWEFTDATGARRCSRLGKHRTKAAAIADAVALYSN